MAGETPVMAAMSRYLLAGRAIAVSVSDSPDLGVLGMGKQHLADAMAEVARHLLAAGAQLLYGGDLRPKGFSELLLELVERYRPETFSPTKRGPVAINYLAWPVHATMNRKQLDHWRDAVSPFGMLVCLDQSGRPISKPLRIARQPTADEWSRSLSGMRRLMTRRSAARVVLGGRTQGFRGKYPGIAEETLLSIRAGKPVFVLGGYGGCALDIATAIGLTAKPPIQRSSEWKGHERFQPLKPAMLKNGLTVKENAILAETPHVDEAVTLISRGLHRLFDGKHLVVGN